MHGYANVRVNGGAGLVGWAASDATATATTMAVMMAPCTHLIERGFTGFYLQKTFPVCVNLRDFRNEVTV